MGRTCNRCGRVAFGVTREYAEEQVASMNQFLDRATADVRESYGNRRAGIEAYERCFHCGGPHTDFRDAKEGDCPVGCTLQPVITEVA